MKKVESFSLQPKIPPDSKPKQSLWDAKRIAKVVGIATLGLSAVLAFYYFRPTKCIPAIIGVLPCRTHSLTDQKVTSMKQMCAYWNNVAEAKKKCLEQVKNLSEWKDYYTDDQFTCPPDTFDSAYHAWEKEFYYPQFLGRPCGTLCVGDTCTRRIHQMGPNDELVCELEKTSHI